MDPMSVDMVYVMATEEERRARQYAQVMAERAMATASTNLGTHRTCG